MGAELALVPEPGTICLVCFALVAFCARLSRRRACDRFFRSTLFGRLVE
jgi:hypothetical protein